MTDDEQRGRNSYLDVPWCPRCPHIMVHQDERTLVCLWCGFKEVEVRPPLLTGDD